MLLADAPDTPIMIGGGHATFLFQYMLPVGHLLGFCLTINDSSPALEQLWKGPAGRHFEYHRLSQTEQPCSSELLWSA